MHKIEAEKWQLGIVLLTLPKIWQTIKFYMSLSRIIKQLLLILLLPALALSAEGKEFTVVIDPGHGGKDAGALGRKTNEKTINLAVAKRLRDLLMSDMNDVNVIMTRSNDTFVTLQGRADMANRKHADIFISIHANSVDKKSPMFTSVNGAAVYTLGLQRSETNLSVAMRENAVMKLEPDYSTTYEGFDPSSAESYIAFEMMQHANLDQSIELAEAVQNQLVRTAGRKNNGVRQAPFWVLVRTSMPAILVELDFICNPAMEKFMASEQGQKKLALAIYRGIEKYRKVADKPADSRKERVVADSRPEELPSSGAAQSGSETIAGKKAESKAAAAAADAKDRIVYKIQFLTAGSPLRKGDSRLKGLSPVEYYKDGNMVKYTYGSYCSQAEASKELKKIKKSFPDAFVIKTCNGKRIK